MGEERPAAYQYGDCVVVCRTSGHLAEQKARWPTEEKSVPSDRDHAHWVGHGSTSAGFGAEYACAYDVRVYAHGCGGDEGGGDQLCVEGSECVE